MNTEIVPIGTRKHAKADHSDHLEAWKNFAQRITKHPFVKQFLTKRDGNACSWCNSFLLNQSVIHHMSYDHYCNHDIQLRIASPTPNNPKKTRVVPDCEGCRLQNEQRFMTCMSKLVLVHTRCNKEISGPVEHTT